MAKFHLGDITSITDSFLRQGHNFITKNVLLYSNFTFNLVLDQEKVKLLKKLLSSYAFNDIAVVDEDVVDVVLEMYKKSGKRNLFLVNLLAFHGDLIEGI